MKKIVVVILAVFLSLAIASSVFAESATPQEVMDKVKEAATYLSSKGEAGLPEFNDKAGPWAWKDSYVFVFDCTSDKVSAHIAASLVGKPVSTIIDKAGNYLGLELCIASEEPNGGWIEYMWPKPGSEVPVRKISYMVKVPGTSWEVGAGIYDDTKSLDELNAMIK
ncbi:MAG: cache domain-containing protein [Pseudodesulfovibrio sp.]